MANKSLMNGGQKRHRRKQADHLKTGQRLTAVKSAKQQQPSNRKAQPAGPAIPASRSGFLTLPQEILDIICRDLIRSGSTSILYACTKTHNTASQYLPEHGVYHLRPWNSTQVRRARKIRIPHQIAATAEHIEVKIDISNSLCLTNTDLTLLARLLRAPILRRECNIILMASSCKYYNQVLSMLIEVLAEAAASHLELVNVRSTVTPSFAPCGYKSCNDRYVGHWHAGIYERFEQRLRQAFGPMTWVDDDGVYKKFRPKSYRASVDARK